VNGWRALLLLLVLTAAAGCARAGGAGTPPAVSAPRSALAERAVAAFWEAFREARYEAIPEVRAALTAAYASEPRDAQLALLLGQLHFWKAAERAREAGGSPTLADHLVLAEHYLGVAERLAPRDSRIPGWRGGLELALGNFHRDPGLTRRGYLRLRRAVHDYPEFNAFSLAFPLTAQPPRSPLLQEAVGLMWQALELCNREQYDRQRPEFDYGRFGRHRTASGPARVCWNTPLVPHNMEGFFLAFGDLLLKAGHEDAARAVWLTIHQVPEYGAWRYRAALDDRLIRFAVWSRTLRDDDPTNDPPYMLRSTITCTGCHAS
jgi:hypothetical protein